MQAFWVRQQQPSALLKERDGMSVLSVAEMRSLQQELRDTYEDDWGPLCPDGAAESLLWTAGEIGEVIDVIKKCGVGEIVENPEVHAHFTEELCDVLMHLTDVMICLNVTPEELTESFRAKQKSNLQRWK